MAKHRRHEPPPPAAPPPAAPPDATDELVRALVMIVFGVGLAVILAPWLGQVLHQAPPAGVVCWSVTRETAIATERERRCERDRAVYVRD